MGKARLPTTNQPAIPLEPTELPTFSTARNADELATAALLFVWYQENYGRFPRSPPINELPVPDRLLMTWDEFVLVWLHRVTVDEMAVVNRTLVAVLGDGARWMPWPLGSESPDDVRAAPTTRFDFDILNKGKSGVVELPPPVFLDVMEVHRRWLAIPKKSRPEHPLVTVIDRRQSTPDKARISHAKDMTYMAYAASEVVRRLWLNDRAVTEVVLSGKPLFEHLDIVAVAKSMKRWLYADRFSLVDTSGVLRLKLGSSSNIYPQDPRNSTVPMVAWPGYDHQLRQDLWLLLAVVYGSTKAIVWTEEEGARLLARDAGGGFRRHTAVDIERWHRVVEFAASIEIWHADERGGRFVKVVYRYQLPNNRVSIDKPVWYRHKLFTLTGAAHRARYVGEGRQYSLLIGCMEYWLARSFDPDSNDSGVAPLLRPARGKSGPGRWARAPSDDTTRWKWYDVLQVLMAEPVINRNDPKARAAAQKRYWRMVEGMRAAGYLDRRPANGDSVEVEASGKKRGVTPTLRFRATAHSCESAQLATEKKWSTTPLFDWLGMTDATGTDDAERDQRRDLRERRKALTLEVVEETLQRNDNNVAKAERELGVGGSSISGDYLHRWLRRNRKPTPSPPPRDDSG